MVRRQNGGVMGSSREQRRRPVPSNVSAAERARVRASRAPLRASGPRGGFELDFYCPHFQRSLELLGRRWTGVILLAMHGGLERFAAIRDTIAGLSDRLLTERLRELEAEGVIERVTTAKQVLYRLSAKGEALRPVITAVAEWTETFCVSDGESVAPLALGNRDL